MLIVFLVLLLFLTLSAFFSASETGLTASSRAKIYALSAEGNENAKSVKKLLENKNRLITSILIGNNLVNNAAAALVTSLTIEIFGKSWVPIATIIITIVILIFSEVLPKTYAILNAEKLAMSVAKLMSVAIFILRPFTFFIEIAATFFLKLFRLDKHASGQTVHPVDAIRGAIEMHHEQGGVIKEDRDMLGGVLDLERTEVEVAMKYRGDIEMIDISWPIEKIISTVLTSQYSRFPVYEGDIENILGILHNKTLMRAVNNVSSDQDDTTISYNANLDIRSLLLEPWYVPNTNSLKDQLIAFKEKKQHFALVVDEYGSLLGIITLEDVLEEIVGNISDEYDTDVFKIEENIDGSFTVDGTIPVRDLNRELGWKLPTDNGNTIAGLIINTSEVIPAKGQVFKFFDTKFEIVKKKKHQITKIKMQKII